MKKLLKIVKVGYKLVLENLNNVYFKINLKDESFDMEK
jgi:hypothetical protein